MSFKPTDLRPGQNIINNYLATIEAQQRGQQLDLESKRLEQEHEEQTKRLQLLQSAQEFGQTIQKHDLAQKYLELAQQGVQPPGGSIQQPALSSPEPNSGMQPISQTLGLGVNEQRVNLPPELNMPPVTTLNPTAAAELRGKTGAIEAEPKARLEAAKQEEIGRREYAKELLSVQQKLLTDEADRQSRESIAREETRRAMNVAQLSKATALQNSVLESTVNNFDSSKNSIIRDYETLKMANATAQGNPSDLELLTAYHRALNPAQASTPEYAFTLPQTLPSFIQRMGLKVDNINNPKEFTDPKTREDLKTQIVNQFKLREKAYQNFRSGEVDKLKAFQIPNPDNLLMDHSKELKTGPFLGDKRVAKNGQKQVFDGIGWEEDKGQYDKK